MQIVNSIADDIFNYSHGVAPMTNENILSPTSTELRNFMKSEFGS